MSAKKQIIEGLKSCVRVSVATAIGGPAAGAASLLIETGRNAMTLVAGDEGTKAGNIVGKLVGDLSDIDDSD
jgi:hypothetical protein